MSAPIVVVGGGLTAGTAVTELRESGYDGAIVVLAEEPHLPYERPPLSKELLQGKKGAADTWVHPQAWYPEHDVDLRPGTTVTSIDVAGHTVTTADDATVPYSALLLATGARPRRLPPESTGAADVRYFRTLDDAERLRERLGDGRRLLVVGAGWIGMEVAASARQLGTTVTVVEPAEQPLLAALGPDIGRRFAAAHRDQGVDLRTSTGLDRIEGDEAVLSDGSRIPVETVVVGIGVVPNDDLARAAGLEVDNGILVDAGLRTGAPDVVAAGDVANAEHPVLGERIRVEHWQNAIGQGRTAAHALLGEEAAYTALPYFFTDQYSLGMEYWGHVGAAGFDRLDVEEGDDDAFAAFWWRGDRLVAAMHVNQWDRSDELKARVVESAGSPAG